MDTTTHYTISIFFLYFIRALRVDIYAFACYEKNLKATLTVATCDRFSVWYFYIFINSSKDGKLD